MTRPHGGICPQGVTRPHGGIRPQGVTRPHGGIRPHGVPRPRSGIRPQAQYGENPSRFSDISLCMLIRMQIFSKKSAGNDSVIGDEDGKRRNKRNIPPSGYSTKPLALLEGTNLRGSIPPGGKGAPRGRRLSYPWDYGKSPYAAFFLMRRYEFRNPPRHVNMIRHSCMSCHPALKSYGSPRRRCRIPFLWVECFSWPSNQ